MRAPTLQPIWLHDHDYGRDAGGADCSAAFAARFIFFWKREIAGTAFCGFWFFENFPYIGDVYWRMRGAQELPLVGSGDHDLGHIVRAVGIVDEGPEK